MFANNRNRVHRAVVGISQDGACTDLFENLSVNRLKGDLSNDTIFKPPLFSLVDTLNMRTSELKWRNEMLREHIGLRLLHASKRGHLHFPGGP